MHRNSRRSSVAAVTSSMDDKLADLRARREAALTAGSPRSIERQHAKGKMLARERIDYLLDPGSFHELDQLARHRSQAAGLEERPYTDGVITGWGTVAGRKVFLFSQDFTVFGGALGEVFAEKIHKMMDLALEGRGAGRRAQRRRRRPHPGGRRQPGQLRRDLPPQREVVGCGAADLGDPRAVRRWRRVLAGDDRLHLHGARVVAHVHHRSRRREDGHRRGGDARGARRGDEPRVEVRRRDVRRGRREGVPRRRPLPAVVPAGQQHGGTAGRRHR